MKVEKLAIIVDTREQVPYLFTKFEDVVIIRDNLDCGDYSLVGSETEIMIERKTLSDLTSSFTAGRERFEDEWKRSEGYKIKFLIIEGRLNDVLFGNYRSQMATTSLLASLVSWSIKYHFNWCFVEDEAQGQWVIYEILKQYKRLKEDGLQTTEALV